SPSSTEYTVPGGGVAATSITSDGASLKSLSLLLQLRSSFRMVRVAVALFRISIDFLSTKSINGAYASAGELICLLQTLGFIEVIHGAVGIVPSGFLFPLMQWGGRTHFLLAIIRRIDEVHELPVVFITFVAWCCIEVNSLSLCLFCSSAHRISFLKKYTVFIVIYPIGVVGEMWLMYQALPVIMEKNLYGDYFSAMPFSYHAFVKVSTICAFRFFPFTCSIEVLPEARRFSSATHFYGCNCISICSSNAVQNYVHAIRRKRESEDSYYLVR
ncbi:Protein-tyrosine phosphatase-like, PTPLA, partial [Cynara cardunculus var. scolymus]